MNIRRENAEIDEIVRRFEDKVANFTDAKKAVLAKKAKAALQKIRRGFEHLMTERQVARTPLKFVRYFPKTNPKAQATLSAMLEQKIAAAIKRIDEKIAKGST